MRENLQELNERGLSDIPVILGGAALTRSYVEQDLRKIYEGRVFYGKDAFEGLHTMDRLGEMKRSGDWDPDFGRKLGERVMPTRKSEQVRPDVELPARSPEVETDNPVFVPPFVGTKVIKGISLDEIAEYLNETELFRLQWGFKPDKDLGEDDTAFRERMRPLLREKLEGAKAEGLLVPQVVYGYFAANSDGDDLVIWKDESRTAEWMRFSFPRQHEAPFLCIADFY